MILGRFPETLKEAREMKYNQRVVKDGFPFQEGHCAAMVAEPMGSGFPQCNRKATTGPGELYCYQHARRIERLVKGNE